MVVKYYHALKIYQLMLLAFFNINRFLLEFNKITLDEKIDKIICINN